MSDGSCSKHGPQDSWEAVCLAVGDALKEKRAVGFVWGAGRDGKWAICWECDREVEAGRKRPHRPVPLCRSCFIEAWELNGRPEAFHG